MKNEGDELARADRVDDPNAGALLDDWDKLEREKEKELAEQEEREEAELKKLEEEAEKDQDDEDEEREEKIDKKNKAKGRPKKTSKREEREQRSITLSPLELERGINEVRYALRTEYLKEVTYLDKHWPRTRNDCIKERMNRDGTLRPCDMIRCKHHLLTDVDPETGALKINFPEVLRKNGEVDLSKMPQTCTLDIAERGGVTLEVVGEYMGLTRERVRQAENDAKIKLAYGGQANALFEVHYGKDEKFKAERAERRLVAAKAEKSSVDVGINKPSKVARTIGAGSIGKPSSTENVNPTVLADTAGDDLALDFSLKDDF